MNNQTIRDIEEKHNVLMRAVEQTVYSFDNDGWDIGSVITDGKYGTLYSLMRALDEYHKAKKKFDDSPLEDWRNRM